MITLLQLSGADPERLRAAMLDAAPAADDPAQDRPAFTPSAKHVLERALRESLDLQDRLIRPRHILLGILREGDAVAARTLGIANITADGVRAFSEIQANVTGHRRGYRERVRDIWDFRTAASPVVSSPGASRIPLLAHEIAGGGRVTTIHYLRALIAETNGLAARVLARLGVSTDEVDA